MLRIGYSPFDSGRNEYAVNFKEILKNFGQVVEINKYKGLNFEWFLQKYDIVIFNWSDDAFLNKKSGGVSIFGIVKQFVRVLLFRLFFCKYIVFVRHNIVPHGTSHGSREIMEKIIDLYERAFNVVWVHSGHFSSGRRYYIPHPLYNSVAPAVLPRDFYGLTKKQYYVVFGRIISYKNIDALLRVIPDSIKIVICGPCDDYNYLSELEECAKGRNNIIIYPHFLPDGAAQVLLQESGGLVVCSKEEEMIASGSVMYGLSMNVPVYTIRLPFARWLKGNSVIGNRICDFDTLDKLIENLDLISKEVSEFRVEELDSSFGVSAIRDAIALSLKGII